MKSNQTLNSIPPLKSLPNDNQENYAFTDCEKANLLNNYFVSISTIANSDADVPDILPLSESFINHITLTEAEIVDVIDTLMTNKAVGDDLISHRVLKTLSCLYQMQKKDQAESATDIM